MQGYLEKKSPSGLKYFRPWQRRYFVVNPRNVIYYASDKLLEPTGAISFSDVLEVHWYPDKNHGRRFDVLTLSNPALDNAAAHDERYDCYVRVYALRADTREDAIEWVSALQEASTDVQDQLAGAGPATPTTPLTPATPTTPSSPISPPSPGLPVPRAGHRRQQTISLSTLSPSPSPRPRRHSRTASTVPDSPLPSASPPAIELTTPLQQALFPPSSSVSLSSVLQTFPTDKSIFTFVLANASQLGDEALSSQTLEREAAEAHAAAQSDAAPSTIVLKAMRDPDAVQMYVTRAFPPPLAGDSDSDSDAEADLAGRHDHPKHSSRDTDSSAHGVALRVAWLLLQRRHLHSQLTISNNISPEQALQLAGEELTELCKRYVRGARFSTESRHALTSMLIRPSLLHDAAADSQVGLKVYHSTVEDDYEPPNFHTVVESPYLWPAFFSALRHSAIMVRFDALQDVCTLLMQQGRNIDSLVAQKQWQLLVYPLLTDVPANSSKNRFYNQVYGYTMNVFALVHFHLFAHSDRFTSVLSESIDTLQSFGGYSNKTQAVARTLLSSLVHKIAATPSCVELGGDPAVTWSNLIQLLKLLRRFVLYTPFWKSKKLAPAPATPSTPPTPPTPTSPIAPIAAPRRSRSPSISRVRFDAIADKMAQSPVALKIKDRSAQLHKFKDTFRGSRAVEWLQTAGFASSEQEAITIGNQLIIYGLIQHIHNNQAFKNASDLYQLTAGKEKSPTPHSVGAFHAPPPELTPLTAMDSFRDKAGGLTLTITGPDLPIHREPVKPDASRPGFITPSVSPTGSPADSPITVTPSPDSSDSSPSPTDERHRHKPKSSEIDAKWAKWVARGTELGAHAHAHHHHHHHSHRHRIDSVLERRKTSKDEPHGDETSSHRTSSLAHGRARRRHDHHGANLLGVGYGAVSHTSDDTHSLTTIQQRDQRRKRSIGLGAPLSPAVIKRRPSFFAAGSKKDVPDETESYVEYGLHWSTKVVDDQRRKVCADMNVVASVVKMFHALKLDDYDEEFYPNIDPPEHAFREQMLDIAKFWKGLQHLMQLLENEQLSKRRTRTALMRFIASQNDEERGKVFDAVLKQSHDAVNRAVEITQDDDALDRRSSMPGRRARSSAIPTSPRRSSME